MMLASPELWLRLQLYREVSQERGATAVVGLLDDVMAALAEAEATIVQLRAEVQAQDKSDVLMRRLRARAEATSGPASG
jgi:hypothetical protein